MPAVLLTGRTVMQNSPFCPIGSCMHSLAPYSFCLPMEGWPGWVGLSEIQRHYIREQFPIWDVYRNWTWVHHFLLMYNDKCKYRISPFDLWSAVNYIFTRCVGVTLSVLLMLYSMFHHLQTGHPRRQVGLLHSQTGAHRTSRGSPRRISGFLHQDGHHLPPTATPFHCRTALRWNSWLKWASPTAAATSNYWRNMEPTCRE